MKFLDEYLSSRRSWTIPLVSVEKKVTQSIRRRRLDVGKRQTDRRSLHKRTSEWKREKRQQWRLWYEHVLSLELSGMAGNRSHTSLSELRFYPDLKPYQSGHSPPPRRRRRPSSTTSKDLRIPSPGPISHYLLVWTSDRFSVYWFLWLEEWWNWLRWKWKRTTSVSEWSLLRSIPLISTVSKVLKLFYFRCNPLQMTVLPIFIRFFVKSWLRQILAQPTSRSTFFLFLSVYSKH